MIDGPKDTRKDNTPEPDTSGAKSIPEDPEPVVDKPSSEK